MPDNFFAQFDTAPAATPPPNGNYFAQFDDHPEGYYGGKLHVNVSRPAPDSAQAAPVASTPLAEGTVPAKTSTTEALGRGVASGLTGNFFDELRGLHEAGGGEPGMLSLGPIIYGAYKRLSGDPEALKRYEDTVGEERARETQLQQEHPVASIGGNLLGAIALPVGGAAGGASLAARVGRGAAVGGAYGALAGAGEGTDATDRLGRATTGGLIGAVGGAAAPAVIAAMPAAARAGGALLGHPIEALRQARDIEGAAAGKVADALKYDVGSGRAGMSAADIAAARASGQEPALMDVGGERTRDLARWAANTSPAARSALEETINPRFADQSKRVADFVRGLIPTPGNAARTQEALDAAQQAANRPAYARAYKAGDRSIMSPELERLTGSPDVVDAMREAAAKGKSRAIADGFGAFNPGVKITDDGRVLFQNKGGVPTYPNIQFWDYTYRSLRDAGRAAFRAGRNDEGSYLSNLGNQLRTELDKMVPEYGQARAGAAAFFGAENALDAGQKFVSMSGSLGQARQAINKMSAPERALFAEGFVSSIADKVLKISNNRSVTIDRIFNSEDGKARIAMALGSQRAGELEAFLRRENMMDLARTAVKGNSTTARQLMRAALETGGHSIVGGAIGAGAEELYSGNISPQAVVTAAIFGGARIGRSVVNAKLAQRVGEMLASDDPKINGTVFRMAANNPQVGKMVRGAESFLEKATGRSAGNAPPVQALLPAQAEGQSDQQQKH